MGEAMLEGGVFAHAKARALLEVVRLAFEGELVFGTDMADNSCATTADNVEQPSTNGPARHKVKSAKEYREYAPLQANPPHRPASTGSSSRLVPGGPCMWCGVTATPQWRRPRGTNKLLCNACGIFFTRYGRLPERSHHAYAAADPAPASALLPASHSAGDAEQGLDAKATASTPESVEQGALDDPQSAAACSAGLEPHGQQAQPQPHQSQPSASTTSLAGTSPHKRKDAPQPEVDLLRCLENDDPGSAFGDTALSSAAPLPAPAVAPAAHGSLLLQQPAAAPPPLPLLLHLGLSSQPYGLALPALRQQQQQPLQDAAASGNHPSTGFLTVAPLELGLQQHISHMQQLGLLGSAFTGLGLLPLLCQQGPAAGAAAPAAAAAAAAERPGYLGVLAQQALVPAAMMPGLPFGLPVGLLQPALAEAAATSAIAASVQLAPRPLYARPPKRQERLPAGESDDSNVSTDSHTATHVDAGMSHDEDEGGTTTAAPAVTVQAGDSFGSGWRRQRGTASHSCATAAAAAAVGSGPLGSGLSASPSAVPGAPLPPSVRASAAVRMSLPPYGSAGEGCTEPPAMQPLGLAGMYAPSGPVQEEPSEARHMDSQHLIPVQQQQPLPQQLQQQQQVILLPSRRSKGPRSRAASASASATPTSSVQS